MGSITANYQSESPLHPAARALLLDAFDRGWADPSKTHQSSREANILLNEAKEVIAGHLDIRSDHLEFLADPNLGYHLGISGLLKPDSKLFYSAVDRSEVFAVASQSHGVKLSVALDGAINYPRGHQGDVLSWQRANGETGIISKEPIDFQGHIFVDATASGEVLKLPERWSSALWSSKAWAGPAGIGIFAVREKSFWRNPLPHLDNKLTSSEISLPLIMASAIALEAHAAEYAQKSEMVRNLNKGIRKFLISEIPNVDIAGELNETLPHLLSFSLLYLDSQILVNELERRGFSVDSGSACSAANIEPSHVLAAMGILTHGNIRINLHLDKDEASVNQFLITLKELALQARA